MELLIGYIEVISNVYYIHIYHIYATRMYVSFRERQRNMMPMIKYYLSIKMKTKN